MKIALNKCYGGFGLSHEAKMLILAQKGINVFPYTCESDYEKKLSTYHRLNQDYSEKIKFGISSYVSYFQIDPKEDCFVRDYYDDDTLLDYKDDFDFYEIDRADIELIETIEALGKKANGRYANLEIVEIPDDFDYKISEYDGFESAYAGHGLMIV